LRNRTNKNQASHLPEETARLVSGDDKVILSAGALTLLTVFIEEAAQGHAVSVIASATELTTQEAADFLQVSRPFIVMSKSIHKKILEYHCL
jgi:hypothetical protein